MTYNETPVYKVTLPSVSVFVFECFRFDFVEFRFGKVFFMLNIKFGQILLISSNLTGLSHQIQNYLSQGSSILKALI